MTREPAASDELADRLDACARGDRKALKAIFDSEAPRLLGIAERILRRSDLAEDAVQEAFLRIWRRSRSFDRSRGSAQGWITAIARNSAIDLLRNGRREEPVAEEVITMHAETARLAEEAGLDDVVGRLDEDGRLRHCLEGLDPERRQAILMAYVFGLSQGEIAGRLGAPLGTVKSWMRRSIASLRECLS